MERHTRLAPSGAVNADAGTRIIDYVFSDESVGRDGHIVKNSAWRLDNFNANPVFLWAHDDLQPPIGRVFNLRVANGALRGSVRYAETEFADSVYQLVRGAFLSAVSTSWQPLAYSPRPGNERGVIFTDVDLLEISQVPLPALPTALATARGAVNVRPLYEWASRALDTGRFGTLERPLVEAVCRAARPVRSYRTVAERLARARELQRGDNMTGDDRVRRARAIRERIAREDRVDRARALQRSASIVPFQARRFSEADRSNLRGINAHLGRAEKHHRSLSLDHDTMGDHIRGAQEVHRRLTKTLKALGEKDRAARTTMTLAALGYDHHRVTRALDELGECLDVLAKTHGSADDTAQSARDAARQARNGINGMVGSDE